MRLSSLLARALMVTSSLAAPAPASPLSVRDGQGAASIVQAIMPTSNSCDGASFPSDCRTAEQATPYLIKAMQKYGLNTAGQIAAVLALIGFESVDMKYKHNVYPGRPGQGTSAMLMPNNVQAYASSIPELAKGLADAGSDPVKILALVTVDDYNFAAAPWWLTSQSGCKSSVDALKAGTDDAFKTYMTACVGVQATDDRLKYWSRAKQAFGL